MLKVNFLQQVKTTKQDAVQEQKECSLPSELVRLLTIKKTCQKGAKGRQETFQMHLC